MVDADKRDMNVETKNQGQTRSTRSQGEGEGGNGYADQSTMSEWWGWEKVNERNGESEERIQLGLKRNAEKRSKYENRTTTSCGACGRGGIKGSTTTRGKRRCVVS